MDDPMVQEFRERSKRQGIDIMNILLNLGTLILIVWLWIKSCNIHKNLDIMINDVAEIKKDLKDIETIIKDEPRQT